MPDPTRVHAYLALIKDQEKEVIAVPDGAGRALCVSSDKHWTLTREWDELHIIAPLVEEADLKRTRAENDADRWRRAHSIVEQERDQAREQRDEAWRVAGEQTRLERDRAEAAERERDEWQASADKWHGEWQKIAPIRDVSRADVSEALARCLTPEEWNLTFPALVNEMCDLFAIEAEKPTGFGKHENTTALAVDDRDIEAVKVEAVNDGKWWLADGALINTCESPNADEAREAAEEYLELAKGAEAVARAIEAKEDPIMARTRELLDLAHPGEYAWTGAFETCRRIAEAEAKKVRDE